MRVILDRSAFHGSRFRALVASPLRQLAKTGQIEVFLTPVFIEETTSQYGSPRAGDDWRQHLEFALEICNGGLFLDKTEIWRNELVCEQGPAARHQFPERRTRRYTKSCAEMLDRLKAIARSDDIKDAWNETVAEREEVQQKKNRQHALYSDIRGRVGVALRENGYVRASWSKYLRTDFEKVGRHLMKLVDGQRRDQLADRWARNPSRYPFYSAFIKGIMYAIFHAAENQNAKIDRNSQGDYEQLAYLVWADAIVSNDQGFLKQAFDTIWASEGKKLFTAEEFAAFSAKVQR